MSKTKLIQVNKALSESKKLAKIRHSKAGKPIVIMKDNVIVYE